MMLWDTAGQEEFDVVTKNYYRGAGACVMVFSTTDRQSFTDISKWKQKVEAECGELPMALMQNKVDLLSSATMSPEEAEACATRLGVRFYRASVKENLNINQVFEYLAESHLSKRKTEIDTSTKIADIEFGMATPTTKPASPTVTLDEPKRRTTKKTKCLIL
eukprot:TRINITY_DN3645_c0_g1_i4.p1 TRINITY_DN3645_c0_g1~~TRINITY_DN3645_c0_g1_i4.p1  ORF type:complete len:162 (-),score=50.95 TRINITY_DN3645_c0_g1_i4:29-514(-)